MADPTSSQHRWQQRSPTSARCQRAAARRARGAAFFEAVILIVFMIIIFGGVQYLAHYFNSKQQALEVARRCAWTYSKLACDETAKCGEEEGGLSPCVPAICAGVAWGFKEEPNEGLAANIQDAQNERQGLPDSETQASQPPGDDTATTQQNLRAGVGERTSELMQLVVGENLYVLAVEDIPRPPKLANAEPRVAARYYMPCNLRHRDPLDVATNLFLTLLPDAL